LPFHQNNNQDLIMRSASPCWPLRLLRFGQWWLPANRETPRGVILLLHGTVVHSGFYFPVAQEYVRHGYAVFGIDLRGWGQSQGYGRRGNIGSYDEHLGDLKVAHAEVLGRYPDAPAVWPGLYVGPLRTPRCRGVILTVCEWR
jgi:alpha-beta hydrolase superfamily lysophospholipase